MIYRSAIGRRSPSWHTAWMTRSRTKKNLVISILAVIVALAAFRLYLPTLVLRKVNQKLALLEGYQGRVDRIGISLWRGAYQIKGVTIEKNGGKVPVPFFSAGAIDFSLEWRALLHRRIVTNVVMKAPVLNFVRGPTEETSATNPNESFARTLKGLAPFDIDRLEIKDGEIHYRDFSSDPKIDIALTSLQAVARNLRNSEEIGVDLPADIEIKGKAFESGDLSLAIKLNPLNDEPTFELKQSLSGVELTKLNDFFDAYAKVRVKKGGFRFYTEIAAKDGKFIGYAEPFFTDMVIDKGTGSTGRKVWAVVATAVEWIFSNKRKKQVATRIPIEGTFDKTKIGLWAAVGGMLKNAYIKALTPTLVGLGLEDVNKVKVKVKVKDR